MSCLLCDSAWLSRGVGAAATPRRPDGRADGRSCHRRQGGDWSRGLGCGWGGIENMCSTDNNLNYHNLYWSNNYF